MKHRNILPAYRGVDRQKCFHLSKAPLGFQWEDEKNHQLSLHLDLSFFGFFLLLLLLFFKWADGTLQQIISKCSGSDEKTTKTKKRLIFYKQRPFLLTCLSCTQRHRWRNLCCFVKTFNILKKIPQCVYCGIFQGYHKKYKILMTNIK